MPASSRKRARLQLARMMGGDVTARQGLGIHGAPAGGRGHIEFVSPAEPVALSTSRGDLVMRVHAASPRPFTVLANIRVKLAGLQFDTP